MDTWITVEWLLCVELEVTEAAVVQSVTDDVQQNTEQLVMEQPPAQDATTAAAAADG